MDIQEISSKTTIHKWCSELSDTSKKYVRKLKKEMQDYLEMKHNMKNTNHVINSIDEMDELYYSKPENNIGSDNVFITPHLDGFLGWIPFMRCWRCIYCITNPNNTTNYFPLNKISETIIILKPNNFVCHDFNRDLHWIKPGIISNFHESRIVLKLHYYDYPRFLKHFHSFYKTLNIRYNSFARNKFLYSINPYKNIASYSLSCLINTITIVGGYTEYFIGLVNLSVIYLIFKGVYQNVNLFYIITESLSCYLCIIQILLGTVSGGTFWRDLLFYKGLTIFYIYKKYNKRFILPKTCLDLLCITIAWHQDTFKQNTDIYYTHLNEFLKYHENKYNIYFHLVTSSLCYLAIFGIIQKKLLHKPYRLPYLIAGLTWILNKYSIPDNDCAGIITILMTAYMYIVDTCKRKITYLNCILLFIVGFYLQEISHYIFNEPTYLSSYRNDSDKVTRFLIHSFWLMSFEIRALLNLV